jgi:hypothetical protein
MDSSSNNILAVSHFNLKSGLLTVTESRVTALKGEITDPTNKQAKETARKVAKVTGMIASMHYVLGDLARLMIRALHAQIIRCIKWDSVFKMSFDSAEFRELMFWLRNIDFLNKRNMFQCNQLSLYPVHVYSDARVVACTAHSPNLDQSIVYRAWTNMKSLQSST